MRCWVGGKMGNTILDTTFALATAKYRPLLLGPETVQRERIHDRVRAALERGPLLIRGGAGHGKTTVISSFVQMQSLPLIWCTLDEWDQDPAQILVSLSGALQQAFPRSGTCLATSVEHLRDMGRDWRRVVELLLEELEHIGPHLLVLDDLHVLDADLLSGQILDTLLRYLPAHGRLILAARKIPRLRWLAGKRVRGGITEIGPQELRFDLAETQELARRRFGLELEDSEIESMLEVTQGWPIGLGLALLARQQGLDMLSGIPNSPEALFDYLSLEVLDCQEEPRRTFLLATSILSELTPLLCNILLDRSDSSEMLAHLEQESLFITPVGDSIYRYHPQFREFLHQTLQREWLWESIVELHQRAGQIYTTQQDWTEAVLHYSQAGAIAPLVEIIRQQGPALIRSGRQETLSSWLDLLPEHVLGQEASLLRYRGELALLRMDVEEAISILSRARELALKQGDAATAALSLALLGRCYDRIKEHVTADRILSQAFEEMDAAGIDNLESRLVYALIRSDLGQGVYRAVQETEAVMERARQAGDIYIETKALATLAAFYFHIGRLRHCHKAAERVRWLQEQYGLGWQVRLQIANIEGYAFGAEGRLEQALDVLQEGERHSTQEFYTDFQGWLLLTTANVLRDMQDPRAKEYYQRSLRFAAGSAANQSEALCEMGWWAFRQGDLDQARELAEEARKLASDRLLTNVQVLRGILEREEGRYESAEDLFQRALDARDLPSFQYAVLLHKAYNQRLCGNLQRGLEDLRSAFKLGDETGLVGGYFWQPEVAAELAAWALGERIYPGYAQNLAVSRLDSHHSGPFLPLLNHGSAEVRRQATTILGELGGGRALAALRLAMADPDPLVATSAHQAAERLEKQVYLRIYTLGGLALWRGGQRVQRWDPQGKVGSKQVQAVLAYLLLRDTLGASREHLVSLLWPQDLGKRSGATKAYAAVRALRQVFEPDLETAAASTYLPRESNRYYLRVGPNVWLDTDEFQQCVEGGKRLELTGRKDEALAAYRQAVELYRGPYLANAFEGANDVLVVDDWIAAMQCLQDQYLSALLGTGRLEEAADRLEEAMDIYRQALATDGLLEEACAGLIRSYKRMGLPEEARRQYLQYSRMLQEELGEEPGDVVLRALES